MDRLQRSDEGELGKPVDVAGVHPALGSHQVPVQTLDLEPASHQLLQLLRVGGSKADAEPQLWGGRRCRRRHEGLEQPPDLVVDLPLRLRERALFGLDLPDVLLDGGSAEDVEVLARMSSRHRFRQDCRHR